MSIFFTADPHFGHANIIKFCNRPFSNVDEMDRALIENWNQEVQPNDEIWILGDMFFYRHTEERERVLRRLNGRKHILLGNHDRQIANDSKILRNFESVHEGLVEINLVVDNVKHGVVLCHYPLLEWNRQFRGGLHFHGHTHNTIPFDGSCRRHDVGVDSWNYAPVRAETVVRKLLKVALPGNVSTD